MPSSPQYRHWDIWVDTGGTFTDILAREPAASGAKFHRTKVLSNSALRGTVRSFIDARTLYIDQTWHAPDDFIRGFSFRVMGQSHQAVYVESFDSDLSTIVIDKSLSSVILPGTPFEVRSGEEAPVLGARLITATVPGVDLPPFTMRLGTTRGTNALLERGGARIAFFVTKGFRDVLSIGTQQRPDLFALNVVKPPPLYETVVEVDERTGVDGNILRGLDAATLQKEIERIRTSGITSAAVAFLHSYKNPQHEHLCASLLRANGFNHVSCSSDLAPFIKLVPRASTSVVNAYLAPVVETYFNAIGKTVRNGNLYIMTSAGGLVHASSYRSKDSLLSGPAGGVVGAANIGRKAGYAKIISFDMGGTSTDVARYDGDFEYVFEHRVGDAHLIAPALSIETVAAGGGSVCTFDGFRLTVGPGSAGAAPGPACYGAGGPLTVTDVNLLLGRLDPANFSIPLSSRHARIRLHELCAEMNIDPDDIAGTTGVLEGLTEIANERMADAIRNVSLKRGYAPSDYVLVAFGGAGGQHACAIAGKLGIGTILFPADAGLLSSYGLGKAVIERFAERQYLRPLPVMNTQLEKEWKDLEREAIEKVRLEFTGVGRIEVRRRILNIRFAGQESVLSVECEYDTDVFAAFEKKYRDLYGFWIDDKEIEVESARVIASTLPEDDIIEREFNAPYKPEAERTQKACFGSEWSDVQVFRRTELKAGAIIEGPALLLDEYSTSVIEQGWQLELDSDLNGVAKRVRDSADRKISVRPEAVTLELFTSKFQTIAEEMGTVLQRTALSVNVKERLDFSCALLDAQGELVVNAPHIPVHLGSLGICVRRLSKELPMEPGDVIVTNHPAIGGSHLPDITVVTPVYSGDGTLIGYAASRAHHGEIGGSVPGSMPPLGRNLEEEGVVIPPTYIVRNGKARWDEIERLLTGARYPTRAASDNLADLDAAVAANHRGAAALRTLAEQSGVDTVVYYMNALKSYAEGRIRKTLASFPDGRYTSTEHLDDGTPLCVTVVVDGDTAEIDFTGSGSVHGGNLNATPAIVNSVVIYVLRLLIQEELPLNEGLMKAVTLKIPEGILNPPFSDDPARSPAVVGGNVETSQRLVDTLLKPFRRVACSQGTMNNVVFGNDRFGYYETICGGCGAGPDFNGASAVHHHMTNTRITDAEIMEHRYPVRLERFAIRNISGGSGKKTGGNGVIRELYFLEQLSLSVLTQHRTSGPYGLEGGKAGAPGEQYIVRQDGTVVPLKPIDGYEVYPGDRFVIKTPGGGGWGDR
jgi:5-oxoprolinase (ATP-hydrolysing)